MPIPVLGGSRKSQYEELKDVDDTGEKGKSSLSFDELSDANKTKSMLFSRVRNVVIVLIAVIILAILGERASKSSLGFGHVKYRPCLIYESNQKIKVIQTSLGEPSAQWAELPCFPSKQTTKSRLLLSRLLKIDSNNSGSTVNEEVEIQPVTFEMPSAEIRVDYSSMPTESEERPPIIGFGGAFTEAAALNYMSLNEKGRKTVMELLFGSSGLGYSIGRVHMNSCDFCVKSYNFDDKDQDFDLKHFDTEVTHDVESGMIGLMLEADTVSRNGWPENMDGLRIIASPWSPPPWMKAPTPSDPPGAEHAENMTGSHEPSCLREGTGPESKYAETWALYFSKFITAYKVHGLHLWGVTVQNEPEFPAPWDACAYNADVEGKFIANHLGPMLNKTHPEVKLFAFDHNKDHAPAWMNDLLNPNNTASQFIDGTAIHWYAGGMDRLLDGGVGSPNMHRLASDLKALQVKNDHMILGTEACHCPSTGYAGGDLKVSWTRAERYAHTVLADLAAGSNGWIDWNLMLDSVGGPNHIGNVCDSPLLTVPHRAKDAKNIPDQMSFEKVGHPFGPVIGDERTRDELNALGVPAKFLDVGVVVQPMYFYMGHISRHVRPGSRPVRGLVDNPGNIEGSEARVFRPKGQVVAGGGKNNLARNGVEITAWPCEGSTRQKWKFNEKGQLQVFGHDWKGNPTSSCISKTADQSFEGLLLTSCTDKKAGSFTLEDVNGSGNNRIVLKNGHSEPSQSCMLIKPLKNDGGSYGKRGGAQVNIGDCSLDSALWEFAENTGEVTSKFFEESSVCLTTGWPFLQMGAFHTPTNKDASKVVVILNEAGDAANYVLRDGKQVLVTNSIPAHSIQTVLLE